MEETSNMNQAGGEIGINKGTVGSNAGIIGDNLGTVTKNEADGEIVTNIGTVDTNEGTVEDNFGLVRNDGGKVVNNYGTVVNTAGGTLYEHEYADNGSDLVVEDTAITKAGVYHGVYVEKDAEETEETGVFAVLKQVISGDTLNLKKLFTKDGYEYAGYQAADMMGENVTESAGDEFTVNAPSWLRLLWKKIQVAVAPTHSEPEPKPVKAAATYIPKTIKVGTEIRVKNQRFKIVEMDDGSYLIATIGKLSEKDLEDMMAFLAKFFTPEQLKLLMGDPELLSEELVAQFFGGDMEHIAFRATKDIFKK